MGFANLIILILIVLFLYLLYRFFTKSSAQSPTESARQSTNTTAPEVANSPVATIPPAASLASVDEVTEKATPKTATPVKKKTPAKKTATKKVAAKKTAAPTKKAVAKKPAVKKVAASAETVMAPAKKATVKAAPKTVTAKKAPAKSTGPERLTKPNGTADDLKKISGVGPKLEKTLNDLGFWHFAQIAKWKKADVAIVDSELTFKGRIERDDWITQAKALAKSAKAK